MILDVFWNCCCECVFAKGSGGRRGGSPVITVPTRRKTQRNMFPASVPKLSMIFPWQMVKKIPKTCERGNGQEQSCWEFRPTLSRSASPAPNSWGGPRRCPPTLGTSARPQTRSPEAGSPSWRTWTRRRPRQKRRIRPQLDVKILRKWNWTPS